MSHMADNVSFYLFSLFQIFLLIFPTPSLLPIFLILFIYIFFFYPLYAKQIQLLASLMQFYQLNPINQISLIKLSLICQFLLGLPEVMKLL